MGGYRVAIDELWLASGNVLRSVDSLAKPAANMHSAALGRDTFGSLDMMDEVFAAYEQTRESHLRNLDRARQVFTAAADGLRAVADNYDRADEDSTVRGGN
jgi:hypothetical protein